MNWVPVTVKAEDKNGNIIFEKNMIHRPLGSSKPINSLGMYKDHPCNDVLNNIMKAGPNKKWVAPGFNPFKEFGDNLTSLFTAKHGTTGVFGDWVLFINLSAHLETTEAALIIAGWYNEKFNFGWKDLSQHISPSSRPGVPFEYSRVCFTAEEVAIMAPSMILKMAPISAWLMQLGSPYITLAQYNAIHNEVLYPRYPNWNLILECNTKTERLLVAQKLVALKASVSARSDEVTPSKDGPSIDNQ